MTKRVSIPVQVLDPSELIGRNLGPLALVNPLLEKMDIRRIVNQHCPPDKRLEVAVGEVIHALVANRLCSPEPLYQVGQWAEYSGAEFLLGVPAMALNDDRLGRTLDVVFAKRWNILADIALHVSASFNVSLAKVHYDPTSFHFTGDYDETSDNVQDQLCEKARGKTQGYGKRKEEKKGEGFHACSSYFCPQYR